MNVLNFEAATTPQHESVVPAVDLACSRIAPSWPLDEWIAVNPYWGYVSEPIHQAAKRIETQSGSRMLMPRSFYREQWHAGVLQPEHLREALQRSCASISLQDLQRALELDSPVSPQLPLMTKAADAQRDLVHSMSLDDFVRHNISQHCASYFDRSQSSWNRGHNNNLYHSWLHHAANDRSPRLLLELEKTREHARSLPQDPLAMIHHALHSLPVQEEQWADYLTALLMDINGWASWCAFERWQATLVQQQDDHIIQLLAIRLAWEHFIFVHLLKGSVPVFWRSDWTQVQNWNKQANGHSDVDWIFHEALEIAYQSNLCKALAQTADATIHQSTEAPKVQAVFCIDVRSEPFRRALEACSGSIQTLGFAGFFGMPIAYTPLGSESSRSQLPGLLAPKLCVTESTGASHLDGKLKIQNKEALRLKLLWKDFRSSASSMFTFVESCGLFYAGSLLKRTLSSPHSGEDDEMTNGPRLRPSLSQGDGNEESFLKTSCDLVEGILKNMSLTEGFARLLLLTGHGSQTTNNPHAAGLNCGACGGHTGEVNARLLAGLLNTPAIRAGLWSRGIAIPQTTYVVAALHNTATDEITLFDTDLVPSSHVQDLARLQSWLQAAGHQARKQRAASVGVPVQPTTTEQDLLQHFRAHTLSWSQVRPEWGLVNNAAFLIAPRQRSRNLDLQGRVFLHDYRSELDPSGAVLEGIMTAPMLVTNWINMQYYASTVDNRQYGSGNKVLHNVVGGRIGVFEGNGGDLRIGLPLQSLHDGQQLRHIPLRLSVFIQAPQAAMSAIIAKHKVVSDLVQNAWLHLFQISPDSGEISRYHHGRWEPLQTNELVDVVNVALVGGDLYA